MFRTGEVASLDVARPPGVLVGGCGVASWQPSLTGIEVPCSATYYGVPSFPQLRPWVWLFPTCTSPVMMPFREAVYLHVPSGRVFQNPAFPVQWLRVLWGYYRAVPARRQHVVRVVSALVIADSSGSKTCFSLQLLHTYCLLICRQVTPEHVSSTFYTQYQPASSNRPAVSLALSLVSEQFVQRYGSRLFSLRTRRRGRMQPIWCGCDFLQ